MRGDNMSRIAETKNGTIVYRDMTAEEEAEMLNQLGNAPAPVRSDSERIDAIEEELAAAKILLGVE